MRVLISDSHKYIYHMNPKVGSNTILTVLYCLAGIEEELIRNPHKTSRQPSLLQRHDLRALDLTHEGCQQVFAGLGDFYMFSFTRNPFARLKSAYNDKLKRYAEIAHLKLLHELENRDEDNKDKHYFQQALKNRISFAQFAEGVCTRHLFGDQHWLPQYHRLRPDICKYDFLGKLENLGPDLRHVLREIGVSRDEMPAMPARLNSAPDPRSVSDYYDSRLQELVLKAYDMDFAAFGYDRTMPQRADIPKSE